MNPFDSWLEDQKRLTTASKAATTTTTTTTSASAVQCKLTGFPPKRTLAQVQKYLPSFVLPKASEKGREAADIVVLEHHHRSTSVILTLPNAQNFTELAEFVNTNQYKTNRHSYTIGCVKYQKKKKKKKRNINNDDQNITREKMNDGMKKPKENKKASSAISTASLFLEYVQNNDNDDRFPLLSDHNTDESLNYTYTRDEVSNIYKEFVAVQQQTEKSSNGNPVILTESKIMAILRSKLRVIKTKRLDNHQFMVTFQQPDGTFPSIATQLENQSLMQLQMKQSEQNRDGIVSISQVNHPNNPILASIGEAPIEISFDIIVESSSTLVLKDVEFRGPHGDLFRRKGGTSSSSSGNNSGSKKQQGKKKKTAAAVVLEGHTTTKMEWTLPTPTKIGIWRARAHFIFEDFTIVRPIQVSCGYKKIQEVLQPVAPYEKKRRKWRKKAKRIVEAPKQQQQKKKIKPRKDGKGGNTNPFNSLPHYTVPEEISDYIQADEFANVMKNEMDWSHPVSTKGKEDPDETPNTLGGGDDYDSSSIVGYGKYWNHLLWASEYQNWKDIELYDIENAQLQKNGRYYLLEVPGLAEKRPSVLRGDLIDLTLDDTLYLGRVIQTQQLTVQLEFDLKFSSHFNPAIDRVHIRFKFSRTTFRTSHHACLEMAESVLGSPLLMPSQNHVDEILDNYEKKKQGTGGPEAVVSSWANRSLNMEQKEAVQQIVDSKLKPLPYIIFGPPGTGVYHVYIYIYIFFCVGFC